MASDRTNPGSPVLTLKLNLEAFETCGPSIDRARECVLACRRSMRHALDSQLHRALARKGYDAGELCAHELTATLSDLNVCDLLQTISMGRKDAVIQIVHASVASRVWCSGGEIIDAESGHLKGELAVYRILGLEAGELCADFRPPRRPRIIQSSTQNLMLEALRRKDECAVLRKQLGEAELVYLVAPTAPSGAPFDRIEATLLDAFVAGARIDAVLANATVGDLELLSALSSLVRRGCLVPSDTAPSRVPLPPVEALENPPPPTPHPVRPTALRSTPVVSAALAGGVALLVSVVALLIDRRGAEPEGSTASTARGEVAAADRLEAPGAATDLATPSPSATSPETITAPLSIRGPLLDPDGNASLRFPVKVQVEPAQAAIWLDGARMATGALSVALLRSGRTHELYINAPGHRSETLLFRDLSPPRLVILERLLGEPDGGERTVPRTETRPSRSDAPRSEAWALSRTSQARGRR
jgi:hypothetical protein